MLLIFIVTNILMQFILNKGYIATRVLLPFYSFSVLCFYDLLLSAIRKVSILDSGDGAIVLKTISCVVCILLVVSNLAQTKLTSTEFCKDDLEFSEEWNLLFGIGGT